MYLFTPEVRFIHTQNIVFVELQDDVSIVNSSSFLNSSANRMSEQSGFIFPSLINEDVEKLINIIELLEDKTGVI
ncbi:hypothetical protein A3K63_05140 [Candidatus Micrarchaeota archaeon RBG_16_49_10]|nr:MAG: hypothetical protein A3K63_05140 [Candidatus Micrarchaeota archaeon RBG_16_49_10]